MIQDGTAAGTGTLALSISGPQAVTLTGASTYTGGTTVGGTLVVNNTAGSATGTGLVTVQAGGTLAGSGFITGPVSFTGGILAPGNSPGTLTLGSTTLDSASTINYQLDTPGVIGGGVNDLTEVLGDLTLAGTFNVTALSNFGAGVYRLFDYTGSLVSDTLALGALPAGYTASIDTSIGGQVNLDVARVPEPSTWVLAATGATLFASGWMRRRKNRASVA